jgi:hypothetical protein
MSSRGVRKGVIKSASAERGSAEGSGPLQEVYGDRLIGSRGRRQKICRFLDEVWFYRIAKYENGY